MTTEDPSPTERWDPGAAPTPPPEPVPTPSEPPPPTDAAPPPAGAGAGTATPPPAGATPPPASEWREPAWIPPTEKRGHNIPAIVFGLILIAIGTWFFVETTLQIDLPSLDWGKLWPLILIGLGLWVVFGTRDRRGRRNRR